MRFKLNNADAPDMNKPFSIALVSFLFLLCIVPLVNAAPVPQPSAPSRAHFELPAAGSQCIPLNLNKGNYVTGSVDVSVNMSDISNINFIVTEPNGTTVCTDYIIIGTSFSFTAPETGVYLFWFNDSSSSVSNKPVTLTYAVASSEPSANNGPTIVLRPELQGLLKELSIYLPIITILFSVVVALVQLVRQARAHAERVKAGTNPRASSENNGDIEVTSLNNDAPVSEEDKKRGVLLRCRNAVLTDTKFYYCGNSCQISAMAEASVHKNGSLAIRFNDGKTHKFRLAPNDSEMGA